LNGGPPENKTDRCCIQFGNHGAGIEASERYKIDEAITLAVMVVENAQRPPWARRLERAKGRVIKKGTYGIMQVTSERPVSDSESIEIACRDHLRGMRIPTMPSFSLGMDEESRSRAASMGIDVSAQMRDLQALGEMILRYNPSERYAELVAGVVVQIDSEQGGVFSDTYQAGVIAELDRRRRGASANSAE